MVVGQEVQALGRVGHRHHERSGTYVDYPHWNELLDATPRAGLARTGFYRYPKIAA